MHLCFEAVLPHLPFSMAVFQKHHKGWGNMFYYSSCCSGDTSPSMFLLYPIPSVNISPGVLLDLSYCARRPLPKPPEEPLFSRKQMRHIKIRMPSIPFSQTSAGCQAASIHSDTCFIPCESLTRADDVEDLSQDSEITDSPCLLSSSSSSDLWYNYSFLNTQLLTKHITKWSPNLKLTWSFSGLSEMSFRLVEVRFLWVMAGLPVRTMPIPIKAPI